MECEGENEWEKVNMDDDAHIYVDLHPDTIYSLRDFYLSKEAFKSRYRSRDGTEVRPGANRDRNGSGRRPVT